MLAVVEKLEVMCAWDEKQEGGDRLTDMGQLETSSRHLAASASANAGSSKERSQFANLILRPDRAVISPYYTTFIQKDETRQEGEIS